MTIEDDDFDATPGPLKRAAAAARARAEALALPLAERVLHALLVAMHWLNARNFAWATPVRYFRVGGWMSQCSKASRRARFALWRSASRFPAPGFSVQALPRGPEELGRMASEALNQADTPWGNPAARDDMLWALRERAAMLARHPARLFGAASTLDAIPPSAAELERAFRTDLEELCPGWAELDVPAHDAIGQRMLLEEDLRRSVDRARESQRSFLEARAMAETLPHAPDPSGSSARL